MADIFISYAREDADAVTRLAAALQEAGYSSWWDRNLTSGSRYLKETEAELKAAKTVLVVWSQASVESHWVADEAAVGRDENRLAAVTFDGSTPPLGYRQFQVTDFSHWKGGANEPQFQSLSGGLLRLAPPSEKAVTRPQAPRWSRLRKPVVLGGAALAALAILSVAASTLMRPAGAPAGQPASQRIAFFGFTLASADRWRRTLQRPRPTRPSRPFWRCGWRPRRAPTLRASSLHSSARKPSSLAQPMRLAARCGRRAAQSAS
jgi:hypothetical protein